MPTPLSTGFATPTLDDIITRVQGDLQAQLSGIDPYAQGSDEWVLARVWAGALFLQHGFLEALLRELFVASATDLNLERIGGVWGITRNQPTQSHYTIEVEATGATTIPAATLLTSSAGIEFLTDDELVFVGAGTDTLDVTSVEIGTVNNLSVGATLAWAVAIADIEPTAEVTVVIEDAVDLEDLEAYRSRILYRIQHHPQGGAEADYVLWTTDIDGVDRCWVDQPGLGEVRVVYDGTPDVGDVQDTLDALRPVTAVVTAIKGSATEIALVIAVKRETGYSATDVEDTIEASLTALFDRQGTPSSTIRNSDLRQAVSNAAGVDYFTISDIYVDGSSGGYTSNSDVTTDATHWHGLDPNWKTYLTWI